MKKILFCAALMFFVLATCLIAAAAEGAPVNERVTLTGIITSAADTDGDGLLDKGGSVFLRLFTTGPAGSVVLQFSEDEFDDMAVSYGEEKNVDVSVRAYAVNAVVSAEYYGRAELLGKDYFENGDAEKIKACMLAACRKNGEDVADTVFPKGNEVYSTYISEDESAGKLSFSYDEESGKVTLTYKGTEYTAAKKIGGKNKIVITENGTALPLSEAKSKIKSASQGEMLALFGDVDGDGFFDVMDIKSTSSFAEISKEWNAPAGVKDKAFSYILFDRALRASAPSGRTFSAKYAEGAGLYLLLANEKGEKRLFTPALCRNGEGGYEAFGAVRNSRITSVQTSRDNVKITFEGGEAVLLPAKERLGEDMTAEICFEVFGEFGSASVRINSAECSWFSSLAEFYKKNDAQALIGRHATVIFAADGTAIYAEITD